MNGRVKGKDMVTLNSEVCRGEKLIEIVRKKEEKLGILKEKITGTVYDRKEKKTEYYKKNKHRMSSEKKSK